MKNSYTVLLVTCLLGVTAGCKEGNKKVLGDISDSLKHDRDFVWVVQDADAGGYEAFPDICMIENGKLICVFYAGYQHVSLPNELWTKGARISYCISEDQGRTWSPAKVLYDTPMDDRDPSIAMLSDGRLVCNFFVYKTGQTMLTFSGDSGKTWTEPVQVSKKRDLVATASSPVRTLSTGRLIMGLYGSVTYSDDGGENWVDLIKLDNPGHALSETDVIELKNSNVYAVHRTDGGPPMYYTISTDGGTTWGKTLPLKVSGHCPYLHRTVDDIIVLGYREEKIEGDTTSYSTKMVFSADECETWSEPILIDTVIGAYPSMVNLKDGSVLIVYYEEGVGSNIRARRFQIKDSKVKWLKFNRK